MSVHEHILESNHTDATNGSLSDLSITRKGGRGTVPPMRQLAPAERAASNAEAAEILNAFIRLLAGPTNDGQNKRRVGKPLWKVDPDHLNALHRHLHRYDQGERVDPDSGANPLVHVAWRALARAYQEEQDDRGHQALPKQASSFDC